jgi:predicted nucleic acid-binding protein
LSAVIDASIVIAALSPDEASGAALEQIAPFMQGGGHAPALWPVEVANALLFKHRRKLVSLEAALDAWRVAMKFPIKLHSYSPININEHVMPIALKYDLTIYDGLYLHLASALGLPLMTLDRRLADAARSAGVDVI